MILKKRPVAAMPHFATMIMSRHSSSVRVRCALGLHSIMIWETGRLQKQAEPYRMVNSRLFSNLFWQCDLRQHTCPNFFCIGKGPQIKLAASSRDCLRIHRGQNTFQPSSNQRSIRTFPHASRKRLKPQKRQEGIKGDILLEKNIIRRPQPIERGSASEQLLYFE